MAPTGVTTMGANRVPMGVPYQSWVIADKKVASGRRNDHIYRMAKRKPSPPTPDGFLTGQLLIAMPAMADPRF
jgi:hypothetical protein